VLRPELTSSVGAERFLKEIRVAARLAHPDGLLYYVMPYLEVESLGNRLERERQLPIEDAIGCAVASKTSSAYSRYHTPPPLTPPPLTGVLSTA
jgi:serine/threonine-protein kinase